MAIHSHHHGEETYWFKKMTQLFETDWKDQLDEHKTLLVLLSQADEDVKSLHQQYNKEKLAHLCKCLKAVILKKYSNRFRILDISL